MGILSKMIPTYRYTVILRPSTITKATLPSIASAIRSLVNIAQSPLPLPPYSTIETTNQDIHSITLILVYDNQDPSFLSNTPNTIEEIHIPLSFIHMQEL